jgi:hypothetical protein
LCERRFIARVECRAADRLIHEERIPNQESHLSRGILHEQLFFGRKEQGKNDSRKADADTRSSKRGRKVKGRAART